MANADVKLVDAGEAEDIGIGLEVARVELGALVLRAGYQNERITLTRHGKPIAALVGLQDLERLRALDAA